MSGIASLARHALAAALLVGMATAVPTSAQQGTRAFTGPGGALAARTIGLHCAGSLTPDEIYDLDLYLAHKRIGGLKGPASDRTFEARFYPGLEADYIAKYRKPESCTAEAVQQARATLAWAREELRSIRQ